MKSDNCTGCSACLNACAKGAIKMVEDERGFLKPQIDKDKCVDCGLCDKVCNATCSETIAQKSLSAFYLKASDEKVVEKSTSGGAFTVLSDYVLAKGGIVCGSVMDQNFDVYHIVTSTSSDRDKMRGSKYVQSEIRNTFKEIKAALLQGKYVLFVGTPCQAAGLKAFLNKEYELLIIVDMLCHGVPNVRMFKDHIRFIEGETKKRAFSYSFRNKHYAWRPGAIQEIELDGKLSSCFNNQSFVDFFSKNLSLRTSCYDCEFRRQERCSDFTIADFWDLVNVTGDKDAKGVSLVTANSSKAVSLISELSKNAHIKEVPYEKVAYRYQHKKLLMPRFDIAEFWETYNQKGYKAIVRRYYDSSMYRRIKFFIKKVVYRK